MQPNRSNLRKVALCVLFICSLVAIIVMGSRANADGETSEDTLITDIQLQALESEIKAEAEAIESRDNKIALYSNYVQLTGVSAEYDEGVVIADLVLFSEAMCDCTVTYTSDTLSITADGIELEAHVGNYYVIANGRYIFVDGTVKLSDDGRIWLPLDILAKIFGCTYTADSESRSVYLTPSGSFISISDAAYSDKDLFWLSRIINAEARGESFIGKLAVGTVVMNRVASSRYPNTVYSVVFDRGQFTPAMTGSVNMAPCEDAVIAARIVLDGYRISDDILFFHSIMGYHHLFRDFVETETEMVIGNHYFYTYYNKR